MISIALPERSRSFFLELKAPPPPLPGVPPLLLLLLQVKVPVTKAYLPLEKRLVQPVRDKIAAVAELTPWR